MRIGHRPEQGTATLVQAVHGLCHDGHRYRPVIATVCSSPTCRRHRTGMACGGEALVVKA